MRSVALLLAAALITAACTSADDPPSGEETEPAPATTELTTEEFEEDDSEEAMELESDGSTIGMLLVGDSLPPAQQRHQEGEPVVGTIAPGLEFGDIAIPAQVPTLLLTVVGSCADCAGAASALAPLAEEFGAQAVLLTNDEPTGAIDPAWTVIVDDKAARAFSGRDRPTAIVIDLNGAVLSRIRPFNQSGTEYDEPDLRFALEIATNQMRGRPPGPALEQEAGPDGVPSSFVGVTSDGVAVEVSTETGDVLRRLADPIADADDLAEGFNGIDEATAFGPLVLLNECCEPAAGLLRFAPSLASEPGPDAERTEQAAFAGWETAATENGRWIAISGYTRQIVDLQVEPEQLITDGIAGLGAIQLGSSNGANPDVAWLRDRLGVVYLHRGNTNGVVEIIELKADFQPISRRSFETQGPASAVVVNAAGNIVVVSSAFGSDETIGQVYDIETAELLAEFPLAEGTEDIDYDASGTYLISVDGEGRVTWQGAGLTGDLGTGFISANW